MTERCVGRASTARIVAALAAIVGWLLVPSVEADLVLRDTRWGFDGKAVPFGFTIFSAELINSSPEPFEGSVRFQMDPFGSRMSTAYEEPCYIAPGGSRWVQFCVLVPQYGNKWVLSWGASPSESGTVRHPDMGAPACVVLEGDFGSMAAPGFRRFPESLLPSSAAAMNGLDAVLLDHAPRWEPVRRRALLEWVRGGGTVHLLQDPNGAYPVFPDDLSVLNGPGARARIGAGLVLRHEATRRTVTEAVLAKARAAPATLVQNQNQYMDLGDILRKAYTPLLRTEHRWWLIYTVAIVYVLAVGPGMFLAGRKLRNYRLALLAMAGSILLATGCMQWAGYRSERESNCVYSMACARQIGDRTYVVSQWLTAFAGRGGTYRFQHSSPHGFYAQSATQDDAAGLIHNGKDGYFLAEMPINSWRSFEFQGVLVGDLMDVSITKWDAHRGLESLAISIGKTFPANTVGMWAIRNDGITVLNRTDGSLQSCGTVEPLDTMLANNIQPAHAYMYDPYRHDSKVSRESLLNDIATRMRHPLMAMALGGSGQTTFRVARHADNDLVTILVMAPSPDGFKVSRTQFPTQAGYVLYRIDLRVSEER